jgi:hypothetical protein
VATLVAAGGGLAADQYRKERRGVSHLYAKEPAAKPIAGQNCGSLRMNAAIPVRQKRWLLVAVTTLAVIQGLLAVLRAFAWFRAGAKLAGQSIPLMDVLAYGVGKLVLATALLYFIFAAGVLLGKGWGWWSGLIAALLNGLLVWVALRDGERIAEPMFWLVVPVILICYLFSRFGRQHALRF